MPIPHRPQSGERNSFLSGEQNMGFDVPAGVADKVKQETEKEYKYGEYEVIKETYDFLEFLKGQIGMGVVLEIISRDYTKIENGDLTKLDCEGTQITFLPELPANLQRLDCVGTQITSLPELPANLQKLDCDNTPLSKNLEENEKLIKYCSEHNILLFI